MCGRFALGVGAAEIREGVADHFSRLLRRDRDNRAPERDPSHATQARGSAPRRRGNGGGAGRRRAPRPSPEDEEAAAVEDEDEIADAQEEEGEEGDGGRALSPGIVEPPRLRGGSPGGIDPATLPWDGEDRFREGNFNVAPRSNSVIVRLRKKGEEGPMRIRGGGLEDGKENKGEMKLEQGDTGVFDVGDQELVIETMQWGLIPHWSKHPPSGPLNTINARSENLIDHGAGGMWQSLKGPKRCLVVVQGYYEWQKKGTTKVAHFTCHPSKSSGFKKDDASSPKSAPPPLMLLAGLYDTVHYVDDPPEAPPHKTFTILTTTPSKSLEFLHDRMPCILNNEEELVKWLDCRDGWDDGRAKLLRPYEGKVECYPVQPEVGKVGTNSSSYILPVAKRKDGIANMFAKQVAKGSPTKPAIAPGIKAESKALDVASPSKAGPSMPKKESAPVASSSRSSVHEPVMKAVEQERPATRQEDQRAVKQELKQEGLDDAIGDDSNAPNAFPARTSSAKRKTRSETKAEGQDDAVAVSSEEDVKPVKANQSAKKKRKT